MTTPDRQVKIIRNELSKHGDPGRAAAKAGVCRQTAARYIQAGTLPSEHLLGAAALEAQNGAGA
jgi:hypothetical protein